MPKQGTALLSDTIRQAKHGTDNTFKAIALAWLAKQKNILVAKYTEVIESRPNNHIFPPIGDVAITEINAPLLLVILRRLEERVTGHGFRQWQAPFFTNRAGRLLISNGNLPTRKEIG